MKPDSLPSAVEAAKRARAVAAAPKYLDQSIVDAILKAIDAGLMSITLDGYSILDWDYTKQALLARGYEVQTVPTGLNETGLKVKWGMSDAEATQAYCEK